MFTLKFNERLYDILRSFIGNTVLMKKRNVFIIKIILKYFYILL